MKQLLKEIVNKITQNLLGKSSIESSPERVNNDVSHSVNLLPNPFTSYSFN